MTSLEFIEKEIEYKNENIKHWENQLEHYPNSDVFIRCIEVCKEQLQTLQSIKAKLETLNILHDKLEFTVIKIDTEQGIKYHIAIKGYNSLISEKEVNTIEKALEVKDEPEE